jgi:hypothetical protein
VGLGLAAAPGQAPVPAYYYPAPGYYATTRGTVRIPTAGYYLNVPLSAVPAPRLPAAPLTARSSNPAQGYRTNGFQGRPMMPYSPVRPSAVGTADDGPDPGWQFRM